MNGFQLTFITVEDRKYRGFPLAEWLLKETQKLGIQGATVVRASEGIGHHHRFHSAHFFELADQPVEVFMAVTAEKADALFALLHSEEIQIFYIKVPIEFGFIGDPT